MKENKYGANFCILVCKFWFSALPLRMEVTILAFRDMKTIIIDSKMPAIRIHIFAGRLVS